MKSHELERPGSLDRDYAAVSAGGCGAAARDGAHRIHAGAHGRRASVGAAARRAATCAALGALTGNQAVQQVQAGLKAIYLSGWQVAGDANLAGQMYPDQSLYPANSVPHGGAGHQQRVAARRPDSSAAGAQRHPLDGADRGRCGGRFRRAAERLRADEGHDRSRAPRRCTSKTSSPRPRSAATWAARWWCRFRSSCRS